MEPKSLRPDADHSPAVKQDDSDCHGVEHGLCGKAEAFLDVPESENAHRLCCDADDEEIRQRQSIVGYNGVLQSADDGDGRVE